MSKAYKRTCKNKQCKQKFIPMRSNQIVCSYPCSIEYANQQKEKKAKEEKKDWNIKKKKMKEELMTLKDWIKKLQPIFNEYIRLRDHHEPCISCGTMNPPEWCAGHYLPRGNYPSVRFDEDNVHKQCNQYCNMHREGS